MRSGLLLAAACSCSQFYEIDQVRLVDAPLPVDAPPPPVCTALGTPPSFGNELFQLPARDCSSYSVSEATSSAAAVCFDTDNVQVVATGPIDAPLSAVSIEPAVTSWISDVRLAPEGDSILMTYQDQSYNMVTGEYTHANGTWTRARMIDPAMLFGTTTGSYYTMSTPSGGSDRRVLVMLYDSQGVPFVGELSRSGGPWTAVGKHALADLGVESFEQASISADGLRVIFASQPWIAGPLSSTMAYPDRRKIYYTDRDSLMSPFRKAIELESVPGDVQWPYMTADCGRLYFSALNTVFYLRQ